MMQRNTLSFGAHPVFRPMKKADIILDQVGRSVAWTQEQAIADYALGLLALERGDIADGEHLIERSKIGKIFGIQRLTHGRNSDGSCHA